MAYNAPPLLPAELAIDRLTRWVDHGGAWRVIGGGDDGPVTVALLRCDAGEEMEQLRSNDPAWRSWLDRQDQRGHI